MQPENYLAALKAELARAEREVAQLAEDAEKEVRAAVVQRVDEIKAEIQRVESLLGHSTKPAVERATRKPAAEKAVAKPAERN